MGRGMSSSHGGGGYHSHYYGGYGGYSAGEFCCAVIIVVALIIVFVFIIPLFAAGISTSDYAVVSPNNPDKDRDQLLIDIIGGDDYKYGHMQVGTDPILGTFYTYGLFESTELNESMYLGFIYWVASLDGGSHIVNFTIEQVAGDFDADSTWNDVSAYPVTQVGSKVMVVTATTFEYLFSDPTYIHLSLVIGSPAVVGLRIKCNITDHLIALGWGNADSTEESDELRLFTESEFDALQVEIQALDTTTIIIIVICSVAGAAVAGFFIYKYMAKKKTCDSLLESIKTDPSLQSEYDLKCNK